MDGFLLEKHHILFLFLVFCANQIFFVGAAMKYEPRCRRGHAIKIDTVIIFMVVSVYVPGYQDINDEMERKMKAVWLLL